MKHINRPHKPDDVTAEFLHQTYLLMRQAPRSLWRAARQRALESAATCEHSWRVIGISERALREIATAGKRTDQQRGHWYPRKTRYEVLFGENSEKLERDAFIEFFFEHDTTVIIAKEQNNKNGHHSTWGRIIPVKEGLFPAIGYTFKVRPEEELVWVREQVAELDAVA